MISQQAVELKAEKSALENSDGCREGAHCFDCFCRAHEEGFIAAASWVIEQYEPLMKVLERAIEHAEFGKISVDHTVALMEAIKKLKQHT